MPIDITAKKLISEVKRDLQGTLDSLKDDYIPTRILQDAFHEHNCPEFENFLASFNDTPSALIEELCKKELQENAAIALASHSRLPVSAMVQIARESQHISQKIALAANPAISPQAANILAQDDGPNVRATLASNKETLLRIREYLHFDESPVVRIAGLQRFADEDAFKRACFDLDIQVKIKAILTGKYDDEFLAVLAHSNDHIIQSTLLERKNLSSQILRPMLFSPYFDIAQRTLELMELKPADQAGILSFHPQLLESMLKNQKICPQVLAEFIRGAETDALILLIETQSLEIETLIKLADNAKPELAKELIITSENHPDIIRKLSRGNKEILYTLALYAELNSSQIAQLFSDADRLLIFILAKRGFTCPDLPGLIAQDLVNDSLPSIREFALSSKELIPQSQITQD
ncbi:hypothetical protein PQO03_18595 [Lentisphaera profundi]|uniref:DUF2336 domain-containing protein n=1 Tax=Lentisphaera profundi TaxID=1658616 RepID=A0ABY7VX43_9BACT|nr:hypothetical protein [Lentisphaera profundi]WDE97838.1 hypothetical protein PQO03_18595 [Lentisphaera profundi]